ncbi:MAG TPA: peptidoglycan DD-metalloendopeptidase family protein [Candidatus Angelobacter sp.]|nr:peptidoglycan DD-metalloendopeptidase family protein [Candidatus Angelobacter sp.]
MTRRSRLAVTFVALLTVSWSVVTTQPSGSALAADPEAELARTRAQLADARSTQESLAAALDRQRSELTQLERRSADLTVQLDVARSELAAVTAEYEHVSGLLVQVREQVAEIEGHLADLREQIAALDAELQVVAMDIERRSADLADREALLQDHLRTAYERSQTSLLEILLSAESLDQATTQVGYMMTVSEQDRILADEIRAIREELEVRRATLEDGLRLLAEARAAAEAEEAMLTARRDELTVLEAQLAELKIAADQKRADQEAALNASLAAEEDVAAKIADNERAAEEMDRLAKQLQQQAAAQQAAIEEARRIAAEEARRRAEAERKAREQAQRDADAQRAAEEQARQNATSNHGFRWPERTFRVTQEWGPTSFALEPPYTYKGTYYPHFHAGIDFANGCGTPIYSAGAGVVVASGQPLLPWDTGFGVVVDHGNGIQTWYWHMQARVVVSPGQIVTSESVIGYEGTTGLSTGCHVHFAVNDKGVWENPRWYLP